MNSYLQFVHNLKGASGFEKFGNHIKNAIIFHYVRQLEDYNSLQKAVISNADINVLRFITEHLDLKSLYKSIVFTTDNSSFAEDVDFNNIQAIINFRRVNHIVQPNSLFRAVNKMLPNGGIYIGRLETYSERKDKISKIYSRYCLGRLFWAFDFIFNRLIPRIPYIGNLYYYLTDARFHAMSKAELLGRLLYCGFETVDVKSINGLTYFIAVKTGKPMLHQHPSFYPVIKLSRIGKGGKTIGVYKLRTMHPYSEYLQNYVVRMHGYNSKGKPANDFRVAVWGKFFRMFWLDEFFQLFNVLKGEMKLVGLRPLSQYKFDQLPEDLQIERVKYKPGCIPPYVALNMPDEKSSIQAERIYISEFKKHPLSTNIKYFFKAIYNILSNKIRSC